MSYFDGIKVNDKVWSFEFGWGNVIEINKDLMYPIVVGFYPSEYRETYDYNGRSMDKVNQTLFWDEIKFDIPEKPKIKLKNNYDEYIKEPEMAEASYSGKSIDQLRKIARLLALRDQECSNSRGYEFKNNANNFYIFEDDNFYNYSIHPVGKICTCIYFKTKDDVQKICNILNSGRFNLEGE